MLINSGKKFARGDALSRHQERPRYCIGSKVQEEGLSVCSVKVVVG